MMVFDIPIVIDGNVLNKIVDKGIPESFLLFWLSEHGTKAVILKSEWDTFIRKWDHILANSESKIPFMNFIKGVVRPYRRDDHVEGSEGVVKETIKVVNRDYDSILYLIVENPAEYRGKGIKIQEKDILTISEFYASMEVKSDETFVRFKSSLKCFDE